MVWIKLSNKHKMNMKNLILAVVFGVASLSSISTKAQVSVNVNIGSQPQWGPTGYNHVDYYYLPDVDAYYYVPTSQYIYQNNGSWIWRNSLPGQYSNYDLYNGYKVVMNTPKPYLSHQNHVKAYSKYKNYGGKQGNIRDSREVKYVNARSAKNNGNQNLKKPAMQNNKVSNSGGRNNSSNNGNKPGNRGNGNSGRDSRGRG
jgi:hypothetical protein